MISVIMVYALYGMYYNIAKHLLSYGPPFLINAVNTTFMGIFFLTAYWFSSPHSFRHNKQTMRLLIENAFFSVFLVWSSVQYGLLFMSVTKILFYYALTPFITAFMTHFLLKKPLNRSAIISILIAFSSFLPVIFNSSSQSSSEFLVHPYPLFIEFLVVTGVISFCYGLIIKHKLLKIHKIPPHLINGTGMLSSGLLFFFVSTLLQEPHITQPILFFKWSIIFIIINIVGEIFLLKAVTHYSTTIVGTASFLEPLFGIVYAYCFFGEPITWHPIIALVGISCALFILYKDSSNRLEEILTAEDAL